MMEYRPKVYNKYNELVKEYIEKDNKSSSKVSAYPGRCVASDTGGCAVKIVSPRNMTATRRNRNYNDSVVIHHHEAKK